MKKIINKILWVMPGLLFCLMQTCYVNAQGVLQVATKTIEKTVRTSGIRTLHINAEKADIELIAWNKQEISVVLELSSKHPDKSVATADLNKTQYLADRSGRDYFLRNYVQLREGEGKPVSNLKAKYTIHLPSSFTVDLKNTFGTITMKGLGGNIRMKADFCNTSLSNVHGKGSIITTFGELSGIDVAGNFTLTSDHTNIRLEAIGGAFKLDTSYGNIEIFSSTNLSGLAIQSKKSVVSFITKNWQQYDYAIQSAYSSVKLPNGFKWKKNTNEFKEAIFSKNRLAQIQINAEFGDLTIK
ncbi:hypothetical protein DSL64_19980 [Dyadobacter luteus]|uniref:DUF4097 domain-containing protein n=1 Tax=Dyadobacter luteus TaxID=2259619 RepID=A0A3D8Y6W8_9BACT|nr:DUF4097 family beta strand repeat-containing protein [Dyadobacter luteus]REA58647.1 hypothetical protein DSL64_19980 [Dyadobacter luteus]